MRCKEGHSIMLRIIPRIPAVVPSVIASLAFLWPMCAYAQLSTGTSRSSGTTSSGVFGSRTVGGAPPRSSVGNTGQQMGAGTVGGGLTSGTGQTGTGQTGSGQTGSVGLQSSGFIGSDSGDVFNVRSAQALGLAGTQGATALGGRGGANQFAGIQNLFSQLGRGGLVTQFGQGGRGGQFGQTNQFGQRGGQTSQSQLRIPIRLGMPTQQVAAPQFAAAFQTRLTKLPGLAAVGPIAVTMEGRTAVLQGTVASEDARQLAEGLARLEPEVLDVRNELVVAAAATAGESLPPAATANSP